MSTITAARVLIVDDHPVVRNGLRSIAEVDLSITIVGEASSGTEAIQATRQLKPNVLLLDVRLPGTNGFDVCRSVKEFATPPAVLFLTSYADNELVLEAMAAGADGYLLKANGPRQIADAIRQVLKGGAVFDPIPPHDNFPALTSNQTREQRLLAKLSPQEMRVLIEVSQGHTDKEAAAAMGLEPKTVRHYLDNLFQKLDVNSRTQAAAIYLKARPR
jgi:DNA-binding NarL/FixJ family response regulator